MKASQGRFPTPANQYPNESTTLSWYPIYDVRQISVLFLYPKQTECNLSIHVFHVAVISLYAVLLNNGYLPLIGMSRQNVHLGTSRRQRMFAPSFGEQRRSGASVRRGK